MLNLLEHFDLARLGPNSADYWHLFIEAKKLAFADRARYYADPQFSECRCRN
jgi:gamma-glutamyltranspeptidase/glutathione hydrolase